MQKVRAHVIISGMVQGVCFRYETEMRAKSFGLTGWVMNSRDGSVEAVFEGGKDDVENMVRWCHEGPSGAIVRSVDVERRDWTGDFRDFDIRYDR